MKAKCKRFISIVIILFLVLNIFIPEINYAEETYENNIITGKSISKICEIETTISPTIITTNKEIVTTISINNITEKVGALSIALDYDLNAFEILPEITNLNGWKGELLENLLILYAPNYEGTLNGGKIANIKFKVKSTSTEGSKEIKFKNIEISKENMEVATGNDISGLYVNIDKTAPVVNVKYSSTVLTNKSVIATITSNEQIQPISGWTMSNDKKTLTKEYNNNVSNEKVIVKDIAGNENTKTINITNIDKTAPVINVKYSSTVLTNKSVVATITSNEQIQPISGWTISNDKKTLTKEYNKNVQEEITIKDLAGNQIKKIIKVANIIQATGDVNLSNSIEIGDLVKLKRHMAQEQSNETRVKHPDWKLDEEKILIGDVNKNGKIDIGDLLKIQRYIAAKNSQEIANRHKDWLNL